MNRADYVAAIENRLGGDRLLWFGTRATDASSLLALEQFSGAFSLISPIGPRARSDFVESCLELHSGRRPDLNSYSVDDDRSGAAATLRRDLARAWRSGTYLAPYRPSDFLSSTYFPRLGTSGYLGMFHGRQSAFEHKPWVESSLRARGVLTIPWQYFADDDVDLIDEAVYVGPRVIRANHSDGGIGVMMLQAGRKAKDYLPRHDDLFVAVAPYLDPNIPLNVGGCVFRDGTVTVHSPSLQLIGINQCTSRRFGYCGNDFSRLSEVLEEARLHELETMVKDVGVWLHSCGYLGAFGIDALLHEDRIHLTEVNPRFQGSTEASASIDRSLGIPDILLEHVGALLGLDAPPSQQSMTEVALAQAGEGRRLSHVVCYSRGAGRCTKTDCTVPDTDSYQVLCLPAEQVVVEDEAMLLKLSWPDSVTDDGFSLHSNVASTVAQLTERLFKAI